MVATGFDSEYYRDDPRAQEVFNQEEEKKEHTPVSTETELDHNEASAEEDMQPESKPADFADDASNVNMWDSIRTDSVNNDNDIPAILRRRKKNKD